MRDSYELQHQAISCRRLWRFGQVRPVHCFMLTTEASSKGLVQMREVENANTQQAHTGLCS